MSDASTHPIEVEKIHLDRENPRLPESMRGKTESEILDHLWHHEVLIELVQSMLANGFFLQEPLLVQKVADDRYTVLEGNRRLGALKAIHGDPIAEDIPALDPTPTADQVARLKTIPCVVVQDRADVREYLGFRHISGLRTWAPEAKARYILEEVRAAAEAGEDNPFNVVARRVGSNSQGIRNSYMAIRILIAARDEFGLNTSEIQQKRFGVWMRCMNSAEIRRHMGIDLPRTHSEVEDAIKGLKSEGLGEVLRDLSSGGSGPPVLADSRDVTSYGRVLEEPRAYATLRRFNDLSVAKQVVDEASLPDRIRGIAQRVEGVVELVQEADATKELLDAAELLFMKSRAVRSIVKGNFGGDGD
jgi:hypothetical protein